MARPAFRRPALRWTLTFVAAALLAGCNSKSDADLVASGQALMQQKDLPGAIIQFKNALQQDPESKAARLALGLALLEQGDPVAALVELRKAQELLAPDEDVVPPIARAMMLAGEESKVLGQFAGTQLNRPEAAADLQTTIAAAHLINNDVDRARAALTAALTQVPQYGPATVLGARISAFENDFDGALAMLEQVLGRGDPDGRAGLLKGDILWQGKKDLDGALAAYRQVLAAHPKAVGAHTAVISILGQQGKAEEAKAQIAAMRQAVPQHPETLFFAAQQALTDKDYKAAREITDRLLKGMPDNPRVLELAGAAEYRQKQYTQAEAFLARALKVAPGQLQSRHLLAQTYLRAGQPGKAVELLMPVLESKSVDGTSLTLAGEAWAQMGETAKADQAFAAAAKVAPGDARVRTSAALAQMARGNTGAAAAQLESIAAEDKGTRADIALVMARLRQNDLNGALKAIDGLERKTPERPVAANLRGRVLLLKRDIPGATRAFEAALAKDAGYFPAIASLAAIDLAAGKPDAARKRFEDLAKANPKSHEPWLALAEMSVRLGDTPDQVAQHLRSAVRANAGASSAHIALITHFIGQRDGKAALTAARDAAGALPNDPAVQDALGRAQLAADSAEQAVSTFRQLATQQPNNPMHQVRLAEALLAFKDNAGSRQALRRALEIRPDFPAAQRALISLSLMEKKPEEGLALVREMRAKNPKDASTFSLEGDIELSRRSYDAAAAAYRSALQLGRTTEVAVRLHATLRAAGRQAEADRFSADWLKDNPRDAGFRFHMGDTVLATNPALAESHYRAVLEIQPRNALAMNNVAWLLLKQKKPGAVAMAEKANELLPGRPQLMDTLAQALAAEGQLPKAIELQKAALVRAPGDPTLRLSLARMLIQSGDKAYARAELEDIAKLGDKFREQAEVAALLKTL
jgi:putative PEP-CTERM system TPR-repeat lipoprotein